MYPSDCIRAPFGLLPIQQGHSKQGGKKQKKKRKKKHPNFIELKDSKSESASLYLCILPLSCLWLILKFLHTSQHNSTKGLLVCLHSLKCRKCLLLPITWVSNHSWNEYIPLMLLCHFFNGLIFLFHSHLFLPSLFPLLLLCPSHPHWSLALRPFQKMISPLSTIMPSQ